MSEAADRKHKLRAALTDILLGAGKQSPGALLVSWPLVLCDAVIRSEAAGNANRQDELIEAIATVLGVGTDEMLTIPEATDRLAGERQRSFIISTLHTAQETAECRIAEFRAKRLADPNPDGRTDLVAQSRHQSGIVEALGYAIELVNLSALPGDNDQEIGELLTPADAERFLRLLDSHPDLKRPLTDEERALVRRLDRLAEKTEDKS